MLEEPPEPSVTLQGELEVRGLVLPRRMEEVLQRPHGVRRHAAIGVEEEEPGGCRRPGAGHELGGATRGRRHQPRAALAGQVDGAVRRATVADDELPRDPQMAEIREEPRETLGLIEGGDDGGQGRWVGPPHGSAGGGGSPRGWGRRTPRRFTKAGRKLRNTRSPPETRTRTSAARDASCDPARSASANIV